MSIAVCTVEGCNNRHRSGGYCIAHYMKRRRSMGFNPPTASLTYSTWSGMIGRCHNKANPSYKNYGGRGIFVFEAWRQNFAEFQKDMGERPSLKHTIERLDNNKGYTPENCRWISDRRIQLLNRRLFSNNKSGLKGVCYDKRNHVWQAYVKLSGKHVNLGHYTKKDDAISARIKGEEKYYTPLLGAKAL